jgi:[glutamine synthetase] adenylyltransferase / [glutamine synthetase]-adenylyl-L-tyrosine phosphorylase
VLFIGQDSALAAEVIREMSCLTPEGRLFPIDARLRPEGDAGPLATSLEAWQEYFQRGRGQLWEAQALTKARPLSGPEQGRWQKAARDVWRDFGQRPELFTEIHTMLRRIAEHRGSDPMLDFKTGPGGLMQLEFHVQARQMQTDHWEPNTLRALAAVIPNESVTPLAEAYTFLRRIETILRRMNDTPVARMPGDRLEQNQLAIRCGLPSADALQSAMTHARATIMRHTRGAR